ncbi:hypothetical protein EGW08_017191 [Elysia chlorotica]|uniref:MYND-type domain-containing protein n=1 Tax=Elysia chlorotica TaxID=188477 RepID=A0A3S1H9V1_ELYCH|nr:hypothetical protein EGW08_017191 [Elysia chlorotica]
MASGTTKHTFKDFYGDFLDQEEAKTLTGPHDTNQTEKLKSKRKRKRGRKNKATNAETSYGETSSCEQSADAQNTDVGEHSKNVNKNQSGGHTTGTKNAGGGEHSTHVKESSGGEQRTGVKNAGGGEQSTGEENAGGGEQRTGVENAGGGEHSTNVNKNQSGGHATGTKNACGGEQSTKAKGTFKKSLDFTRHVYRRPAHLARLRGSQVCPDGQRVIPTKDDFGFEPTTFCCMCRNVSLQPLKRCIRCLRLSYCDRQCQKQHFAIHVFMCKIFYQLDVARARIYEAVPFFYDLKHAKDYTTDVRDLPTQEEYLKGKWCNLLTVIETIDPERNEMVVASFMGRRRVFLPVGLECYTHPSFSKAQRQPGPWDCTSSRVRDKMVLIMGAYTAQVAGEPEGIKVDNLDALYVIDLSDHPQGHYHFSISISKNN